MPERVQIRTALPVNEKLKGLLERANAQGVTEEQLRQQRISFAYGNAPKSSTVTKESVQYAANNTQLKPAPKA